MKETKYTVKYTTSFKKDYKRAIKRGLKIELRGVAFRCGRPLSVIMQTRFAPSGGADRTEWPGLPAMRVVPRVQHFLLPSLKD